MLLSSILVLLVSLPFQAFAIARYPLFQSWFPSFEYYLQGKIENVCNKDYETFLSDPRCTSCDLEYPLPGDSDRAAINVFNCLLSNSDEFVKSNLAVGSVVLGLLPTVLSFSGSTTTEVGLLALKRPLLATILTISAPSVFPLRALESETDPIASLRPDRVPFESTWAPSGISLVVLGVTEYALAVASAANVGTQIWALCTSSLSAMGPVMIFFPLTWVLASLGLYLLGTIQTSLRVRLKSGRTTLKEKIIKELTPCASHARSFANSKNKHTLLSFFLAWFVSILSIVNIVYGTAALSSMLFVPALDAFLVGLRFLASAAVARAIVMYELSGMSHSMEIESKEASERGHEEGCVKSAQIDALKATPQSNQVVTSRATL